ncbi:MAG: nicotinate phosphoribosyltransferase, partial [Dermatophilaceae bacterium]|nr:nicotinate phosphoribosyltransferase [Dermatophilaceae bacterium]
YGVGTSLVTGSGHPASSMVYKLVAREGASGELEPVAKKSKDKTSVGGRKWAMRRRGTSGRAEAEIIGIGARPTDDGDDRSLMVDLVRAGERIDRSTLADARARHTASRSELPPPATQLQRGEICIPTIYEPTT